jgi:hypothetical protein
MATNIIVKLIASAAIIVLSLIPAENKTVYIQKFIDK